MRKKYKIEGIVERYAPGLEGHGDHGFSVLLLGSRTVFAFRGVRKAYSIDIGRQSSWSSVLVELLAPGDHISFVVSGDKDTLGYFCVAEDESLRNWTLEHRLIGSEINVTPAAELSHRPLLSSSD